MAHIHVEIYSIRSASAHFLKKLLMQLLLLIPDCKLLCNNRSFLLVIYSCILATAIQSCRILIVFHLGNKSWIHIDEFALHIGLGYFVRLYDVLLRLWLLSILSFF